MDCEEPTKEGRELADLTLGAKKKRCQGITLQKKRCLNTAKGGTFCRFHSKMMVSQKVDQNSAKHIEKVNEMSVQNEGIPLPGSSGVRNRKKSFESEMRRKVDESNDQSSSLLSLPRELLNTILCFLSVYSLALFSLTSRESYVLSKDEAIWRVLFEKIPREIAPNGVCNVLKNMPGASYHKRYRSLVWAGKAHLCYEKILQKPIRDQRSLPAALKGICSDFCKVYDVCGEEKSAHFYFSVVRYARCGNNTSIIYQLQLFSNLFYHVKERYGEKESIGLLKSLENFVNIKDFAELLREEKSCLSFVHWFLLDFVPKYEQRVKDANFDFPEYGLLIHLNSVREEVVGQLKKDYAEEISSLKNEEETKEKEMNERDRMLSSILRIENSVFRP